jgi:broad specificity phosphatase PhoE
LVALSAVGCDSGYVKTHKSESGSSTTVTVEIDRAQIERDKEDFRRRSEAKLREWDSKLAEMQTRAEQATGQAKVDLERQIDEQKPKLEEARRQLKEIDATAGEKWADFKQRSNKAWDDISSGFDRAFSRFR